MSLTLLRVRVEDFKGIDACEVSFNEAGVTVIHGPNEHGKSSLMEAIDLLMTTKSSSGASRVKAVKPVDRDTGSLVEVELRCGDHHMTCRKRFNKNKITELDIHAPKAEQLTGDEAHDRMRSVIEDETDEALFEALWFQQGRELESLALDDSSAVAAALDALAGGEGTGGGEDALLERVQKEYLRYYTPGGGKGQALRKSEEALQEAKQQLDSLQDRLDALEGDIDQVADLERQISDLKELLGPLETELEERSEQLKRVRELEQRVDNLATEEQLAIQQHKSAADAVELRKTLVKQVGELAGQVTELEEALGPKREQRAELDSRAEELKQRVTEAESLERAARESRDAAEKMVELIRHRDQLDRLEGQRKRVDVAAEKAAVAKAFLEGCRLDEAAFEQISASHQSELVARKLLGAGAPKVELRAHRSVEVSVDGEPVALDDGGAETRSVEDSVVIYVPDVLSVEVTAGSSLETLQRDLSEATRTLADACEAAGVADMAEAKTVDAERRNHETALRQADDEIDNALGGLERQKLVELLEVERAAVKSLETDGVDDSEVIDAASAESALNTAKQEEVSRRQMADQQRLESDAAREAADRLRESVIGDEAGLQKLQDQHNTATDRLEAARREQADEALAEAEKKSAERMAGATEVADEMRAELAKQDPEAAALLEENAKKQMEDAETKLAAAQNQLIQVRERVKVAGGEGLGEQRDAADVTFERSAADNRRLESRANAAKALHDELTSARDEAYRSYREPLRKGICDVGRIVFGSDFDVVLGDELEICERVLDGETLPWDSLSSGAREQLAVLTAIAAAQLAADGGTPLILDDTLGYTDPTRLETLGAVLGSIEDSQVIVLTCVPDRFRRVGGAHTVSLPEALAAAEASMSN